MSKYFPANSVLNSYLATEGMLTDILRVVPYCSEHKNVWSPMLVTVIFEACSQLDSLWKYEAGLSQYTKPDPKIPDYFQYFGEFMAPKWVVFWGEGPERIFPYKAWTNRAEYQPLAWWKAYNALKHDRLLNRTMATLRNAVQALAGLFLAILRCEPCRPAIAQAKWLSGSMLNPELALGEDSPSTKGWFITAETAVFSYAVGWSKEQIQPNTRWEGQSSHRFQNWFETFSDV